MWFEHARAISMATRRPPPKSLRTPSRTHQKAQHKALLSTRKTARPPAQLYIGAPEVEALLLHELGPEARPITDGVVATPSVRVADPIFARQRMNSVKRIAMAGTDAAAAAITALLDDTSPASVHVFAPEVARTGSTMRGQHPLHSVVVRLQQTLDDKLRGRREKGKLGPPTSHVLQVLVTAHDEAWVSVDEVDARALPLVAWPSPFVGGRAVNEADKDAPSSAHRKLREALRWLDVELGADDIVVDLGAAPGGWTRVARDAGAKVVAVDRARLDEVLERDPLVVHVKKDAKDIDLSSYAPTVIVCDVVWEPQHAVEIARRCLAVTTLRAAVITLKLKREPVQWDVLDEAKRLVRDAPLLARLKHLSANKHEVTLLLRRIAI